MYTHIAWYFLTNYKFGENSLDRAGGDGMGAPILSSSLAC